ncbi:retrovirus-related Pol polyprotein from transposon 412 [Trichonephila clavipes]|nr:retrovirus-related Pol polyprotein from transposon 412 [Trichonephila clavipes]
MEQQIADLLRQNQDLIRALQIRDDSHSHKVTVQFDKFDEENENFDSFIERFETYLDVQNVPIANRAKVFVSSLSAKLYQLLKNLLAPDIPSDQTLDKLKDALKKHLTPKPLIIPSRHKFLNRKQTEGEGISTYIAELRALAMNCDYDKDMLNIMLRDVFVINIIFAQVPTMQKRIVDLFQVHVISVGKLGTLNRHASHLKRQMRNRLNKNRKISSKQIKPTNIVFKTYKGDSIIPLGYVTVRVQYKNQKVNLNLYIVKENLDTILGREWLYKIHLDWPAIKAFRAKTEQNLNNLLREYKDIFDDKLGEINNYEAKLKLRHGVKPIFCRVRTVPFALKGRVENEIDRLEKEGIIEKVDSSEWATPVVPVVKSDCSIRLCADYSVTLNPNLIVPQHPLPRLDEIFGSLNGENNLQN